VWVRDLLHNGGSMPVVGRVGYLRLCPLATPDEWIYRATHKPVFSSGFSLLVPEQVGGHHDGAEA
jgi:hypothetical protein